MQISKKRIIGIGGSEGVGVLLIVKGADMMSENQIAGGVVIAAGFLILIADKYLITKG